MPVANGAEGGDNRLERLFDYTKFHIGIYITLGAALISVTKLGEVKLSASEIWFLRLGIAGLFVAGLGGGVIAANTVTYLNYTEFNSIKIGPLGLPLFHYSVWAGLEHCSFWFAITASAYGFVTKQTWYWYFVLIGLIALLLLLMWAWFSGNRVGQRIFDVRRSN
jgi:hypothetical protein